MPTSSSRGGRIAYKVGYIDISGGEFHFWPKDWPRPTVLKDAGAARMAQLPPPELRPPKPKYVRPKVGKEPKLEGTQLEEDVAALVSEQAGGAEVGSKEWGAQLFVLIRNYLRSLIRDPLGQISYPEVPVLDQITYPVAIRLHVFWKYYQEHPAKAS
jgi:hypothetical protein